MRDVIVHLPAALAAGVADLILDGLRKMHDAG